MSDVLLAHQNAIEAILKKIAGSPFATGEKVRIYHQGDTLDLTALPVCALTFNEETADDIDTRRTLLSAPWALQIWFDADYAVGKNTRERHADLLELVKNAINSGRTLAGTGIDARYTGGGNALSPAGTEADGDQWTFTCRFESTYRHLTTDSSASA